MGRLALQYYCGNCNNILKEVESELNLSHSVEPCPSCGTLLSETLQKRALWQKVKTQKPATVFQKASDIPKLTLDIAELDSILNFLTPNQLVCIAGPYSQKLIERLCVRAQLPQRYGGLNSNVLLIDGANSSDLYQCVSFAQQYGLDVKKVLSRIISSRAFTVYQLVNLIINELTSTIKIYDVKVVVISNLLNFFTNDPYLDKNEMKLLLEQLVESINKIRNCLVIISLVYPTEFDEMVMRMFDKTIRISNSYHCLAVEINDNNTTNKVFLKKLELESIPTH